LFLLAEVQQQVAAVVRVVGLAVELVAERVAVLAVELVQQLVQGLVVVRE